MKLLCKLMYNGAGYAGYQAQDDARAPKPSVQRTLTAAFSEALGFPCHVTGCSRTDAGVHALGFCATVEPADPELRGDGWLRIPIGRVHRAVRRCLPPDIAIAAEAAVGDAFHPRYSAVAKEYRYAMSDAPYENPFWRDTVWHLPRPLPPDGVDRMRRAGEAILGGHDFTSFMAAGSKIRDARRTVLSFSVEREAERIEMRVAADGFLYHMVRILAGTLVGCAMGAIEPEDMPMILEARDRSRAGVTAPAHGLALTRVDYDPPIDWICE